MIAILHLRIAKKIVNSFNCGSEDIIVFYYIGHGTENTGASKYPFDVDGTT